MGATEEIEFLARSETRVQILKELSGVEELTRAELRERLDCSRTTIQRNLDVLVEEGLVSNSDRSYSLNPGGRYLSDPFLSLLETTEVYERLQPFLKWIDKSALDIDLRHFRDATLQTPREGDPYAMINHHVAAIRSAETGFALLSFTGLHATEAAHEQVTENGAEFELVVEPDVADTFQSSPQYAELMADLREAAGFTVWVTEDTIPFGLCQLGETVQIVAGDDGEPKALVETEAKPVREWAQDTYADYKTQATRVI